MDAVAEPLQASSVRSSLVRLIAPMVLSLLFIGSTAVVDAFFVARLGIAELTAFGFAGPVSVLLFQVFIGFGIGVTSVAARAAGAGDQALVRRVITQSGVVGLGGATALGGAVLALFDPIFRLLGASDELLALVRVFMLPWLFGTPFFFFVIWATAAMRGIGDTKVSALVFMAQAAVNMFAVPLLVFGLGPLPSLGFAGAALANVLSYVLASLLALRLLRTRGRLISFESMRGDWRGSSAAVFAVALPATLTYMLAPITNGVVTALLAQRASDAVAAYGVVARFFDGFLAMVPLAIGSGLAPFVGHRWAARKLSELREAVDICRRAAFLWGLACYGIVALVAEPLARLFADDPRLVPTLVIALRVLPLGFASYGLLLVANSVYNTIGQARRATMLAALRTIGLSMPLALLADRLLGPNWIFAALAVSSIATELVAARWLARDGLRGAEQRNP